MLAEFLLTPDALADDDGRNGTEVIRELTECFFPKRRTPQALLCKLGEEWEIVASRKIAQIKNPNHQQAAMSLFQRLLSELSVRRPSITMSRSDEAEWIGAAKSSASLVPMNRIIVSRNSTPPASLGTTLKDFTSDDFWDEFGNPRNVGRDIVSQERVLRALCTHSEWLILRLPQIKGGNDDEIVTAKQIINQATNLPPKFVMSDIELQIPLGKRLDANRLLRSVVNELRVGWKSGAKCKVAILPQGAFVNREIVAGEYARLSDGSRQRRARWWVTMNHVAVGGNRDAGRDDANSWSLFSRREADIRLTQICASASLASDLL